jgi:predicted ATPase
MVLMWCGELDEAARISERAIQVCEAGGHDMWTAHAQLIHGSCISEQGDPERGLQLMDTGYALWTSTGTIVTRTFYLALRAPAYAAVGRIAGALDLINEACRIVTDHGERYYEAEVLRIKGELLLLQATRQGADSLALADATLAQAQTTALALGYHSLGLRVATSMARRHAQSGDKAAAVRGLQAALTALKEGHATRDQRVAREMLAQLTWTIQHA